MLSYFIVFLISCLYCRFGEYLIDKKKRNISCICFIIAVAIVSIMAGVRDYTIGTDISTYGHWLFLEARKKTGLYNFVMHHREIDILYSCFVYIVAQFFKSEHWLYFYTGVWIYGFALAGIIQYKKYASVSWIWVCYLLLLYGDTLNAMRQCMAMSLGIWAFHFVIEKKYVKYVFTVMISCLFHIKAVVFFGIWLIYEIIKKKNNFIVKCGIVIGLIFTLLIYNKILVILINWGLFNEKFERYLTTDLSLTSINPILIRIPFLIIILIFYHLFLLERKNIKGHEKNNIELERIIGSFIILMIFFEIIIAEMRSVNVTLYRISLYFCMFRCIAMGRVVKVINNNNRLIVKISILLLLGIIWVYQNVYQGNNDIYPFTSQILGIY